MKHFLFIVCVCIAEQLIAQVPDWVDPAQRSSAYPSSSYLTGYSEDINTKNDPNVDKLLSNLREDAKAQLINSVRVKIKSEITLEQVDTGGKNGTSETFRQYSSSFSELIIKGLEVESYYDKKKKKAYAYAYALRENVISDYYTSATLALEEVKLAIKKGDESLSQGSKEDALANYELCNNYFRNAESSLSVVYVLQRFSDAGIDSTSQRLQRLKLLQNKKIGEIQNVSELSIDEAAHLLAQSYSRFTDLKGQAIRLGTVTYQDTEMGSAFTQRLFKALEQKLSAVAGLDVRSSVSAGTHLPYLFSGTYWEDGSDIKIITTVRNATNGSIVASAESRVAKIKLAEQHIGFMPENFAEAYSRMLQFKKDDVIGGGLQLEVWTSKGQDNLMFTENERMKLYVRVNQECYVRFIYHMADGSQVLLLDNYYIGTNAVNKVYEIPYEFECAEPFGIEILQANAQTVEFDPLNTVKQYGYDFIVEDISSVLIKTRGFKKVEPVKPMKTETRMTITTFAKDF